MKINDVVTLMEFGFGAPGSRAMGTGNFALLHRAYVNKRPRLSRNLQLDFGNNQVITLDDADIEAVANYYDTLPSNDARYAFVYDVMSRGDKFDALLKKLGRRSGVPEQPSLLERDQQKDPDLSRGGVRSAGLSTALRQAYAKYPQAQSDIEALIMHDMDTQKNTSQELQSQNKINQRQDDIDTQLRDVARKQSKKIGSLDDENDALSAELDRLSQELDAMHGQTVAEPKRKADTNPTKKPDTDSGSYGAAVSGDNRVDRSQQRAADAEKRQAEPAKLRTGSATFKPLGATPAVTKPAPTIDVIDQPATSSAVGQMAQQLVNPLASDSGAELPTSMSTTNVPAVDQAQPDLFSAPVPQSMNTIDAEPEPELPGNVSDLAQARRTRDQLRQATAQQARDAIRTGTFESQELRRMRELAGLSQ